MTRKKPSDKQILPYASNGVFENYNGWLLQYDLPSLFAFHLFIRYGHDPTVTSRDGERKAHSLV